MKTLRISIPILVQVFLFSTGHAQTVKNVEGLTEAYQDCLDTGVNMLGCSKRYFLQMDSMLTIVYNQLRATLSNAGREALKKEQLAWLNKRDRYFKSQNKLFRDKFKSVEWGSDMAMITYDNNAAFVKDRVMVLMRRVHKD